MAPKLTKHEKWLSSLAEKKTTRKSKTSGEHEAWKSGLFQKKINRCYDLKYITRHEMMLIKDLGESH
jgi:hypothetical protein